jgi:hypothetical protein
MIQHKIDVSEDIIENSVTRSSSHCMIAQAVKQTIPWASGISVDLQTIRFSNREERKRYIYLTPLVAQQCIVDFDQGKAPEPFTIRLRNPQVTNIGRGNRQGTRNLAVRKTSGLGSHEAVITGGKPPPKAGGRTRRFGIRGLSA